MVILHSSSFLLIYRLQSLSSAFMVRQFHFFWEKALGTGKPSYGHPQYLFFVLVLVSSFILFKSYGAVNVTPENCSSSFNLNMMVVLWSRYKCNKKWTVHFKSLFQLDLQHLQQDIPLYLWMDPGKKLWWIKREVFLNLDCISEALHFSCIYILENFDW